MKEATSTDKTVNEYLSASGATAISIVRQKQGYRYLVGRKTVNLPTMVTAYWVDQGRAAKIARHARGRLSFYTDKATAERELQKAAHDLRATLTPNMIVVSRAAFMAKRLDELLGHMNRSGQLTEFNQEYRRRRTAATARGEGFISLGTAMARLRKVLIRMLINKQQIRVTPTFFDEIFGVKKPSSGAIRKN